MTSFRSRTKARIHERPRRFMARFKLHILAIRARATRHRPRAYIRGLADGYEVNDDYWEDARGLTGRDKAFYLQGVREGLDTLHAVRIDNEFKD